VLNPLLEIARALHAPIHVTVFTDEVKSHAVDYLQNSRDLELFTTRMQAANEDLNIVTAPLYGSQFEEAITTYISANNTGLLVMITHKRNFLESIFNKSLTKKMSYHTNIPLLSLPIHS
jgi:K+-sensing histidine kinase KdpD